MNRHGCIPVKLCFYRQTDLACKLSLANPLFRMCPICLRLRLLRISAKGQRWSVRSHHSEWARTHVSQHCITPDVPFSSQPLADTLCQTSRNHTLYVHSSVLGYLPRTCCSADYLEPHLCISLCQYPTPQIPGDSTDQNSCLLFLPQLSHSSNTITLLGLHFFVMQPEKCVPSQKAAAYIKITLFVSFLSGLHFCLTVVLCLKIVASCT